MDYIGGKIIPFFNIVAASNENTVVTEYESVNQSKEGTHCKYVPLLFALLTLHF